jgi:hypothetical protein
MVLVAKELAARQKCVAMSVLLTWISSSTSWHLSTRVSYWVVACSRTLDDALKSNLKGVKMGRTSSLVNLNFFFCDCRSQFGV